MVLISGGSSVGTRDYTVEALTAFDGAAILMHGIAVSPGKPTILARVLDKPVWGLPGHAASAMVVFARVVRPFLRHIAGAAAPAADEIRIPARLSRNLASAQGRTDFVRVRLVRRGPEWWAEPVLGKSGLLNTMIALRRADRDPQERGGTGRRGPGGRDRVRLMPALDRIGNGPWRLPQFTIRGSRGKVATPRLA